MLTDDMPEVFIISGHTVQGVRQELRFVHLDCFMYNSLSLFLSLIVTHLTTYMCVNVTSVKSCHVALNSLLSLSLS